MKAPLMIRFANGEKHIMVKENIPDEVLLRDNFGDDKKHDALFDIKCSIAELNYYRKFMKLEYFQLVGL